MRITLVAVGRFRRGPLRSLFDDYVGRLGWTFDLREVEEKRPLSPAEIKAREGRLLLDACPPGALMVALDRRGRPLSSEAFAGRLQQWQDEGRAEVAFLVGGAEGLSDRVLEAASLKLSFGPLTWPHMLVRVMLAEQLFRAWSILTGHPYHRG